MPAYLAALAEERPLDGARFDRLAMRRATPEEAPARTVFELGAPGLALPAAEDTQVTPLNALSLKLKPLVERIDQLSLRERGLIFGGGVALIYVAWQALLMDPLTARARAAEQRLAEVQRRNQVADEAGLATERDPALAAAGPQSRARRSACGSSTPILRRRRRATCRPIA